MSPYLSHLTDRELLEQIYLMLVKLHHKIDCDMNDEKQFGINLVADLVGTMMEKQ